MKGLENHTYQIWYVLSHAVALIFILAAWKAPRAARSLFALLFGWACWINGHTALNHPELYQDYATMTFSAWYRNFIQGWLRVHTTWVIGVIATCQGLIAVGFLLKGWVYKAACGGAIIFLLAIAPLGVRSAFPATVLMATAVFRLWRQHAFIWSKDNHELARSRNG